MTHSPRWWLEGKPLQIELWDTRVQRGSMHTQLVVNRLTTFQVLSRPLVSSCEDSRRQWLRCLLCQRSDCPDICSVSEVFPRCARLRHVMHGGPCMTPRLSCKI